MIDQEYIDSLLELPKREAKDTFVEYAAGFGIELKKNLTIEAMIEKFKEEINALENEPMPEAEPGAMSMSELLAKEGARIEVQSASPVGETVSVDEVPEFLEPFALKAAPMSDTVSPELQIDPPSNETVESNETPAEVAESPNTEAQEQTAPLSEVSYLPGYSIMPLIGPTPGYMHIPYWVYDFIVANPDWKHKIADQRKADLIVLNSILYHICRHGIVRVRESRNSRFIDIT